LEQPVTGFQVASVHSIEELKAMLVTEVCIFLEKAPTSRRLLDLLCAIVDVDVSALQVQQHLGPDGVRIKEGNNRFVRFKWTIQYRLQIDICV
jgi:hypothetical protein